MTKFLDATISPLKRVIKTLIENKHNKTKFHNAERMKFDEIFDEQNEGLPAKVECLELF